MGKQTARYEGDAVSVDGKRFGTIGEAAEALGIDAAALLDALEAGDGETTLQAQKPSRD